MKKACMLAFALATMTLAPALAKADSLLPQPNGYPYFVVPSCGSASFTAGTWRPATVDITGTLCGGVSSGGGSQALAPGDASGTIATANAFQTPAALAQSNTRKACTIYNPPTATENLLVYDRAGGTPTPANSYAIVPGQSYTCNDSGGVNTNAIQLSAATAGHPYVGSVQ